MHKVTFLYCQCHKLFLAAQDLKFRRDARVTLECAKDAVVVPLWVITQLLRRHCQSLYKTHTDMCVCEEVVQLQQNPAVCMIPIILAVENSSL